MQEPGLWRRLAHGHCGWEKKTDIGMGAKQIWKAFSKIGNTGTFFIQGPVSVGVAIFRYFKAKNWDAIVIFFWEGF